MTIFELKLFAVLFMVIDHIAMYFGNMPPLRTAAHFMRMIGRLSFPLFLFCMAPTGTQGAGSATCCGCTS